RREPRLPKRLAERLAAAVLPDDCRVNRAAGGAFPDDGGFALVGDAHRGDVPRLQLRGCQRLAGSGELRGPDLERVVLDPAGPGIVLAELALGLGDDAAGVVEDDAARTRGALVQGEQVLHPFPPANLRGRWGARGGGRAFFFGRSSTRDL